MANIVQYDTPVEKLQPQETGAEALARSGMRIRQDYLEAGAEYKSTLDSIGGEFKSIGETVDQHQTMMEISHGAASLAQIQNGLTQKWNDTLKTADPNDPSTAQKFHDQFVTPALQQWQQSFATKRGQAWATEHAGELGAELARHGIADMATMSGIAAQKNLNDYILHTSNAVASSPSSLEFNHKQMDSTIDAMVANMPNLSAAEGAKLKASLAEKGHKELDQAAFSGIADKNPAAAEQMLRAGRFQYIDGSQAMHYVKMMEKQQQAEARQNRILANQERAMASQQAASELISSVKMVDGKPTLPDNYLNQALHDPRLLPGEKIAVFRFGESMMNETDKLSNPDVKHDLQSRLTMDPNSDGFLKDIDIIKARNEGELSKADALEMRSQLHDLVQNPVISSNMKEFNNAVKEFQGLIDSSNVLKTDGWGRMRYQEFYNDHLKDFMDGIKAGKTPQELLTRDGIFKDAKDYLVHPDEELAAFGQKFTANGGGIPARVRVMEQYKLNHDRQKKVSDDAAKAGFELPPGRNQAASSLPPVIPPM